MDLKEWEDLKIYFPKLWWAMLEVDNNKEIPDITIAPRITLDEAFVGKNMIASYRLRTGKEEVVEIKAPRGAQNGNTIRYSRFW